MKTPVSAPMKLLDNPVFKKSLALHRKNGSADAGSRQRLSKEGYAKALKYVSSGRK